MNPSAFDLFLASDLDGTLLPPAGSGTGAAGLDSFRAFARRVGLRTAYVTGRHLELAVEGLEAAGLPRPLAIAADVGTTVHWLRGDAYVSDPEYRDAVAATPGVMAADEVRALLRGIAGLSPQEPERQADFKVSYYVAPRALDRVLEEVAGRLAPIGRARLVPSHDALADRALLDVLPEGVGKATALAHIRRRLGLGEERVVYAGDSGNDRDAWLSGCPAIVVANTSEALRDEIRREAALRGLAHRVFLASRPFAGGVVEGLRHFGRASS